MKMKRMTCMLLALCLAVSMLTSALAADEKLRRDDRGAAVTELQRMLSQLGYSVTVDGVFGSGTEAAVKRFQGDKGLKVDGIAGSATLSLLRSLTSSSSSGSSGVGLFGGDYSVLRPGEVSNRVRVLQRALNDLGYNAGTADAVYGKSTEAAVRWFQQVQGLSVDGKAGEKTLKRIDSLFNADGTLVSGYTPPSGAASSGTTSSGMPTRVLRPGDAGDDVRSVQTRLKELGYYAGAVDGKYGTGTTAAVYQFQLMNGLKADGKAGSSTNAVLFSQGALAAGSASVTTPSTGSVGLFGGNYTKMIRGEVSSRVRILQTALNNLGYQVGAVDGAYGSATEAAVRLFQQRFGLSVDGKAGEKTLKQIESCFNADGSVRSDYTPPAMAPSTGTTAPSLTIPSRVLRPGDTGDDVRGVQTRLQALGYYTGALDGKYGNGTTMAVLQFQLKNGLKADGKAGADTNAKLFSDSAVAANGTSASQPTATPTPSDSTPTATPAPQYTVPSRTLRSGDTGADVVTVQTRLKELGYYTGTIDGVYGSGTVAAVTAFQRANGLNADGKAGTLTYAVLFSANAGSTATAAPTTTPNIYVTLKKGSAGELVTQLQKALLSLGYTVNTNGSYTNETVAAVKLFQQSNGLSVDGIAGTNTLSKLYSGTAVGPKAAATDSPGTTTAGVMSNPPSNSDIKLLHWYNDIKPNLTGRPIVQIYDPASGLTWNIQIFSKGQHADGEPPTLQDTQIMYKAFGNKFTWDEKPVFVKLPSGVWCIASMHDHPHEADMIPPSVNGFTMTEKDGTVENGHLCIHFPRDMAETQKNAPKNGVRHQNDIRKKWKEMTGQDIPW